MTWMQLVRRNARSPQFWIITLVALALCVLTARLSLWQLQRAAQKQQLASQLAQVAERAVWQDEDLAAALLLPVQSAAARAAVPHALQDLSRGLPHSDWLYQKAHLHGTWQTAHTIYAENRQMQGRVGFWVYTPLKLQRGGASLLVLRGFVPRNRQDRKAIAQYASPAGEVLVQLQLQGLPSTLPQLGPDEGVAGQQPDIRLNIDIEKIRAQTGLPLLGFSAREYAAPVADGLQRQWDAPNLGLAKHQGYAAQWAALCLTLVLLYLWYQWLKPWRLARRAA